MAINYNLTLKIIFLIFLSLLFLYLLYMEYLYTDKLNLLYKGTLKKASNKYWLGLRELFVVIIPGTMSYRAFLRDEFELNKLKKELETKENEIKNLKADNTELKSQRDEVLNTIRETKNEINLIGLNKTKLSTLKSRDSELTTLIKEADAFEKERQIAEKESLSKEIDSVTKAIDNSSDKVGNIIENVIKKSSLISFDFDLNKFLDSLSKEELLAFSGLLFNGLALNYAVSIIIVLYGDYLIKRFDLENKFPKLAKFIQLRRKLQNYYLKICFVWLLVGILPPLCMYVYILFPKLLELFSLI